MKNKQKNTINFTLPRTLRIAIGLLLLSPIGGWAQEQTNVPVLVSQAETEAFENNVVKMVMAYNAEIDKCSDTLAAQHKRLVEQCFQIPQDYIAKNPGSPYGLQALKMLGTGGPGSPVTVSDLESLFASLAAETRNSAEGQAYAAQLKSWPWLNGLKSAAGTAVIKGSLLPQLAGAALAGVVGKKLNLQQVAVSDKQLTETELISALKKATLIVSMAYKKTDDQTLQVTRLQPL